MNKGIFDHTAKQVEALINPLRDGDVPNRLRQARCLINETAEYMTSGEQDYLWKVWREARDTYYHDVVRAEREADQN